jgi:hypothetical protein
LRAAPALEDPIVREIEDAVFTKHAETTGQARVVIVLRYGFTFGGIASANRDVLLRTSLSEWRAKRSQG